MRKADRERVESIRKDYGLAYYDEGIDDDIDILLNVIDKQELRNGLQSKVIQVAKEYSLYSIADVDRKFKVVLKELEGENNE